VSRRNGLAWWFIYLCKRGIATQGPTPGRLLSKTQYVQVVWLCQRRTALTTAYSWRQALKVLHKLREVQTVRGGTLSWN
jgi:hypothetical protein